QRRHRRSFVHQLIRPVRHTRETLVPDSSFLLEKMTDFGTSTVPNPVFRTEVRQFGCPRQYRAREACTAPDTFVQQPVQVTQSPVKRANSPVRCSPSIHPSLGTAIASLNAHE